MQHALRIEKQIDVRYLRINLDIYDEDLPSDLPFRFGNKWEIIIDIDRGMVMNWHHAQSIKLSLKVRDSGIYTLYDKNFNPIRHSDRDDSPKYVPNHLLPPSNGYGDYLELDIDGDGKILNWYDNPSLADFFT